MVTTFTMVTFAWIFFRATDVTHAFDYISHIFSMSLFEIPTGNRGPIPYILSLIVIEWFQRRKEHGLEMATAPRWVRPAFYTIVVMVILLYGFDDSESFIYFQF